MHVDSDTIEAKDAGLAICGRWGRSHLFPCHAIHAKLRQTAASEELRGLHFSCSSGPASLFRVEVGLQKYPWT
jgi:hypothetical protein